jgi:hypothetical protein
MLEDSGSDEGITMLAALRSTEKDFASRFEPVTPGITESFFGRREDCRRGYFWRKIHSTI